MKAFVIGTSFLVLALGACNEASGPSAPTNEVQAPQPAEPTEAELKQAADRTKSDRRGMLVEEAARTEKQRENATKILLELPEKQRPGARALAACIMVRDKITDPAEQQDAVMRKSIDALKADPNAATKCLETMPQASTKPGDAPKAKK